jgi:hypothetical protein
VRFAAVRIVVSKNLRPGNYTIALTVTEGIVQRSAYLFVRVD